MSKSACTVGIRAWRAVATLAGLLLTGCAEAQTKGMQGPNVLLVTLDTTRADRLGCYGNERIATPNLDRLAAEGVVYDRAFTPIPSTLPSHCSILTGMYPARHGVHDNGVYHLDEALATLPERMHAAGYRTAAFISAFVLDRQFGLDQGFDLYDDRVSDPLVQADPRGLARDTAIPEGQRRWVVQQALPYQRRADAVTAPAITWIGRQAGRPFFLWVHYFDPHVAYTPPAPWDTRYDPGYRGEMDGTRETFTRVFKARGYVNVEDVPRADMDHMIALYDGEISFMDASIGALFSTIEAQGLWDDTLVVVVGDHGEGFGEHGQIWEHSGTIFDEAVRVPLIVKPPGRGGGGRRVAALARTIDVAPTVLALAGLPPLPAADGVTLPGLSVGGRDAEPPSEVLLEALRERQIMPADWSFLGLRDERQKLMLLYEKTGEPQPSLFDLVADPAERAPIAAPRLETLERLTRRTLNENTALKQAGRADAYRDLDALTSEALRSLGYIK
ncbi:MAG TPA: sulfatase [Candidatus Polarisedimenticolia bacterium]|nr:sulfatase [Candidatus Polarisedimenticolia bacterium]